MKIKHLLLAASAMVIGLASCSKDDTGKIADGEKNIYLQFTQAGSTRADVEGIKSGTSPEFNSGHLFFTTSGGEVKRYIRINNSGIQGTLTPAALQAGTVIESLSADITMVYLYGNVLENQTLQISDIGDMDEYIIEHEDERDPDWMVSNVTLKGSGRIIDQQITIGSETYERYAKFQIAPLISRIEVQALSAAPYDAVEPEDRGPKEFDLEGIFVNNYHPDLTLGGSANTGYVNYGTHIPSYQSYDRRSAGQYKSADRFYLYDDGFDGTSSFGLGSAVSTPIGNPAVNYISIGPDKEAWAYNVFALGEPHLVFHLSNVVLSNGMDYDNQDPLAYDPQDAYLTLTRFVRRDNGAQVTLEGGHVYRITNLVFTDSDLSDTPEPPINDKKDVYVEVEVMEWVITEVDGKFD
ncbi:MAG: hypothetical protein LUF87_04650 [Alistipes sp.]|nr:hypothetical protein [Alistipes sp.]